MASIQLRHLTKSYGSVQVLKEFNETFQDGEFITLLGPSGCGKTTILRMIAGFEKPTSGEIWIDDQLVSSAKSLVPPEKRNIGMVFQSYAVWPHMTVFENVAYPLKIRHAGKAEIQERTEKILTLVHLEQYAQRLPSQLSGGQQQRVALARALLAEPRLLLLDEPLSNLDAKLRETMRFEIKEIAKASGITVVYVTHDQTEAMAMSDRIFLLNGGMVQQVGSPEEIYNRPSNPFVADFLGKVAFFDGTKDGASLHLSDWEADIPCPAEIGPEGPVTVGIRPENIRMQKGDQGIPGIISRAYYLGDTTDFRVRVGRTEVRVISDGPSHLSFRMGERVSLQILDLMVFPREDLREHLRIRT
ncbi:MAG: ABC transporter ATP-binding protein [Clostridia bacterium]|nr:ABC transporter ATP-binding protein [Clostridia bacterium]